MSNASAIAVDEGSSVRSGSQSRSIDCMVRVAAALSNPFEFLDPERASVGPMLGADVLALSRSPAFRGPMSRALLTTHALDGYTLKPDLFERLASTPMGRWTLLVLCSPRQELYALARLLSGAILHRRVLGVIMKADRVRMAEALGEEGFLLAEREAAVLYRPLAGLDSQSMAQSAMTAAGSEPNRSPVFLFGLAALHRLASFSMPELSKVLTLRFPAGAFEPSMAGAVAAPTLVHLDLVMKLVARRMPSWQAFIA